MPHSLPLLLCLVMASSVHSAEQENHKPSLSFSLMDTIDQLLDMGQMQDMRQIFSRGRTDEAEHLPILLQPFAYWLRMFLGLVVFGVILPSVYIIFMCSFLINIFIVTPITSLWGTVATM